MLKHAFCLHAHFYLPPRANPMNGILGSERSAAPFRNWNDRLYEEVYRPNISLGNFEHLSFDMGNAILLWLEMYAGDIYQTLVDSVAKIHQKKQVCNLLGVPLHQSPLPLLSRRDRLTQLQWGKDVIKKRFGAEPMGIFLPEFAADIPTLQSAVDAGYQFTILRASQVNGVPARGGAGPYTVRLSKGDTINVFVVNEELSSTLVHEMNERGGAAHWVRSELIRHAGECGPLTLLYVDGNGLGQEHVSEPDFVHYLLKNEVKTATFQPVCLEEYFKHNPTSLGEIELIPYERKETEAQSRWRDALHDLMTEANILFTEVVGENAWRLRDKAASGEATERKELLRSQMALQRAWANVAAMDTFSFVTDSHIVKEAAYAVLQINLATGTDLSTVLLERLTPGQTAEYNEILQMMKQDVRATGIYEMVDLVDAVV